MDKFEKYSQAFTLDGQRLVLSNNSPQGKAISCTKGNIWIQKTDHQEILLKNDTVAQNTESGRVIRWAGSKRLLLPKLLSCLPLDFNTYIEPFAGSAALFFRIQPSKAILNDMNPHLINAYRVIRDQPLELYEKLAELPKSQEQYYSMRSQNVAELSLFDQAIRFVYLNRYCYNAVYRTNRKGEFNVPYGRNTGQLPNAESFSKASSLLADKHLLCKDYSEALKMAKPGDFVYLDPPYTGTKYRGEYGPGAFSFKNEQQLWDILNQLDSLNVKFLLSYTNSGLFSKSERTGWIREHVQVRRHVSGFAAGRCQAEEILVRNYQS